MKLHSIEVDRFGALRELTLADLDPGLNVIYGPNGSGKSTLLHFVRGILCGFDESRRIGLLPPANERAGGGALQVRWEGEFCRLARSERPGAADSLRVTLVRNQQPPASPHCQVRDLRTDLVPLLFAIGNSEAHALDALIRQARQDGIQLVGRVHRTGRAQQAAGHIQDERFALLHSRNSGLIADLTQRRAALRCDVERLTEALRQRCGQWESTRIRRPQGDILHWHRKVTFLRQELAAAECDLREAEDRRWMPQPPPRTIVTDLPPGRPTAQRHPHLDRQRIHRLQQLDRRIEQARTLLAETARARLDISLRIAQIAGSDDTAPAPFLQQVRDSLKTLEDGVLELRDDSAQLSAQQTAGRCVCDQWRKTTREAADELSRRVYQLCEQVSRYELGNRKSLLGRAEQTVRDSELQLLRRLEELRAQRLELLDAHAGLLAWKGRAQTRVEQQHCECREHSPRRDWRLTGSPSTPAPQRIVRTIHQTIERPTLEQLTQLQHRVGQLRGELASAVAAWRQTRRWQPQQALPDDIRELQQQLDHARMELNLADVRLADSRQRWRVLSVTGEVLRRTLDALQQEQQPTVIQWASGYLRELTGGRHVGIAIADDGSVTILGADGSLLPGEKLSRGTRDQLALSLRLALVRTYKARGVNFPLLLDDVLVDTDQQRLKAAVDLLQLFAREHSQQIVYLTCQTHLAGLFVNRQVMLHTLPGSTFPDGRAPEGANKRIGTVRGWVDQPDKAAVGSVQRTGPAPAVPSRNPAAVADRPQPPRARNVQRLKPLQRRQPDGPYWLSMDAPVSLIPSIGSQMGRRLAGLGVRTTAELIDLNDNAMSLRLASLQITPERLGQWQAEARLLCCVPDLTGPDAQQLARAGVTGSDQLAGFDVEELLRALDRTAQIHTAASRPSRQIVQRWIHNARRARRLIEARRFSRDRGPVRDRSRGADARRSRRVPEQTRSTPAGGPAGRRRQQLARRRHTRSQSERGSAGASGLPLLHEPDPVVRPFVRLESTSDHASSEQSWRFYLSLQSPVVDAPSIGPTTANRLSRIGVITVADLLNRPAAEIAQRLKNRRIKEETVLQWQQQSRLMCRIPQLRGHDAQVLVACEITEPEQVAKMSPEALIALVGPFVETVEGRRLLRSSTAPDLAEVADWIHWARNSRTLRAA